jgi:hypothetical protein
MYKEIKLWKGANHHILIDTDEYRWDNWFGIGLDIKDKDSKGRRSVFLVIGFAKHELRVGLEANIL